MNTGTLAASNGAILEIKVPVNNVGGTVDAQNGSTVLLDYSGTISGGTTTSTGSGVVLSDSGTLDGTVNVPTNQGTINVPLRNALNTKGTIANDGTVALGGFIFVQANTTLTGSGQVVMSPNSDFLAYSGLTLTNESPIEGAGSIGGSDPMAIINKGNIIANVANHSTPLIIDSDNTGFTNSGTLTVNPGSQITIHGGPFKSLAKNVLRGGTYNLAGTLLLENLQVATMVTGAASITLSGPSALITDQSNDNALASLAFNKGTLAFMRGANLATTASTFTTSKALSVDSTSSLKVGGSYVQSGGSTTVDGKITAPVAFDLKAGSLFGTGTILGPLVVSGTGAVTAGDSAKQTGILSVASYTQSGGSLKINVAGTTAGSGYGPVAASNGAALGGTLNIKLLNKFVPAIGDKFTILPQAM